MFCYKAFSNRDIRRYVRVRARESEGEAFSYKAGSIRDIRPSGMYFYVIAETDAERLIA